MNRSKQIGTSAETAVVQYARLNGFGNAERRALHGTMDLGDVLMSPGFIVEVKGGQLAEQLHYVDMVRWVEELRTEQENSSTVFGHPVAGMLVTKRRGYGANRAGFWWAHFSAAEWFDLSPDFDCIVSTTLNAAFNLARRRGYGDEIAVAPDRVTFPFGFRPVS